MTRELKEICRQEAPILVKALIRLAYLADQGTDLRTMQDYLGHRDPKHTAHYTRVAGHRFEGLWR
jgi:hypothetical protein